MPLLTPDQHADFVRDGVLILRGLVPAELCEAAATRLDEIAAKSPAMYGTEDPDVLALVTDKACQVLDELLGDELKPEQYNAPFVITRQPEGDPPPGQPLPHVHGMHFDDDYPTIIPNGWCIRMSIFPRKVIPGGGGFIYSPGSHIRGIAQMMLSPDSVKDSDVVTCIMNPVEEFTCEAGDAVIMVSVLGHTGSVNHTNPLPRHFVSFGANTTRRLSTWQRPLDELATIEKAFSVRYFQKKLGLRLPNVPLGDTDAVNEHLARGWAPESGIEAYGIQRWNGATHLYVTSDASTSTVRRFLARDWSGFREGTPLETTAPVGQVDLYQSWLGTVLGLGSAGADAPTFQVYYSDLALADWQHAGTAPAPVGSAIHFSGFGSKSITGFALLTVDGTAIRLRCKPERDERGRLLSALLDTEPEHEAWAGDGRTILDAYCHPILSESRFALVMDLDDGSGRAAHFILSGGDGAMFGNGSAEPLRVADADHQPFQVKPYMRSRNFWLMTYLVDTGQGPRLFWGSIDWTSPVIRPIHDVDALQEAMANVGLV